jgi:hypothetical protein
LLWWQGKWFIFICDFVQAERDSGLVPHEVFDDEFLKEVVVNCEGRDQ